MIARQLSLETLRHSLNLDAELVFASIVKSRFNPIFCAAIARIHARSWRACLAAVLCAVEESGTSAVQCGIESHRNALQALNMAVVPEGTGVSA